MIYFKPILLISIFCLFYLLFLGAVSYFKLDLVIIGVLVELLTIPVILTVLILFGFGFVKFINSKEKRKQYLTIGSINFISISLVVIMTYNF